MFDPTKPVVLTGILLLSAAVSQAGQAPAQAPAQSPEQSSSLSLEFFYLGPGDEVEISVWQEPTLSATVIVRPDGRISLPLVGSVDVAGRTPEEIEIELQERLRAFLTDPIVVVIARQLISAQVSLLGEVRNPGRYPIQQRLSVLDLIAAAGGFSDFADIDNVIVLRPQESGIRRIRVNIKKLLDDESEALFMMLPGDIVYVK